MANETWEEMRFFLTQSLPKQIDGIVTKMDALDDKIVNLSSEFKTSMAVLMVKQKLFSVIISGIWAVVMLVISHFLGVGK